MPDVGVSLSVVCPDLDHLHRTVELLAGCGAAIAHDGIPVCLEVMVVPPVVEGEDADDEAEDRGQA